MGDTLLVHTLENGVKLYTNSFTEGAERWAKGRWNLLEVRVFLAEIPNGERFYIIVDKTETVFETKNYEQLSVHIDIMGLRKENKC